MIGFWSRTKSECLFWIRKLYRHILYIIFLRTNIGSLRIGNFGHFWTYSTPLLQTTILNRKHYVPSNFFFKRLILPFYQFGELFFFVDKTTFLTTPQTVWLPTSDQSAPCRVWFWYAWRDDLQFAKVHAPSPRDFRWKFRRRGVGIFYRKN